MCVAADVTDRNAIVEAVKAGEAKYGPTDLMVNNAGVMLLGFMWEQDPTEWDRMVCNISGCKYLYFYICLQYISFKLTSVF